MNPLPKLASRNEERRRHQRVKVVLLGRYMLADRKEFPCQTIDLSPCGLAIVAPVIGRIGERVICYLDEVGRMEGTISRSFASGFAVHANVPLNKREKLADQLTWLANRHALALPEDRRHERIVPRNTQTLLSLSTGELYPARLIDVSRSGAAITVDIRPTLGTKVMIGKTSARVTRAFDKGIGVEFTRVIPAEEFNDTVRL